MSLAAPSLQEALRYYRPMVVAHRGASGEAPENTLAAFELALSQGAHAIELDIHLSMDDVPVVIHDPTLERTTGARGLVRDMPAAALKLLDAGAWFGAAYAGERVPTLEEVLEWAEGAMFLMLELKGSLTRHPGLAERVVDLVRRHEMVHQVELFSFDIALAQQAKKLCHEVLTGVCCVEDPGRFVSLARQAKARFLHAQWQGLSREVLQQAHRRQVLINAWTVNDEGKAGQLAEWGVDCITTDFPARLAPTVRSASAP